MESESNMKNVILGILLVIIGAISIPATGGNITFFIFSLMLGYASAFGKGYEEE